MVFGLNALQYEQEKYRSISSSQTVELVRRNVLEELRKLSLKEAENEINQDMGFQQDPEDSPNDATAGEADLSQDTSLQKN